MAETTTEHSEQDPLRRIDVLPLPKADIEAAERGLLEEFGAKIELPGFRPGKAPDSVVRERYGAKLEQDTFDKATKGLLEEYQESHKDVPLLGQPKVEIRPKAGADGAPDESGDFEIAIEYDLMPELPVVDLTSLLVKRPVISLSDEQLEEELRKACKDNPIYSDNDRDRAIELTDQVTVAQQAPEGEQDSDQRAIRFRVDSERVPDSLRQLVMGKKVGDKFDAVSDDGGTTTKLQIREVRRTVSAEPSDELAKANGMDSVDEMRDRVRQSFDRRAREVERALLHCRIGDALAERLEFDVPRAYLALVSAAQAKAVNPESVPASPDAAGGGAAAAPPPDLPDALTARSLKHLRVALWAEGFRQRIGLSPAHADVVRAAAGWFVPASEYAMQTQAISQALSEREDEANRAFRMALSHMTVEAVAERVKMEDVPMSLDEAEEAVKREDQAFTGADQPIAILPPAFDMPRLTPFAGL